MVTLIDIVAKCAYLSCEIFSYLEITKSSSISVAYTSEFLHDFKKCYYLFLK